MRAARRLAGLAIVLWACALAAPGGSIAAEGDLGELSRAYTGTTSPTGTKRSESVLWFHDRSWWAVMWDSVSGDFHIHELDRVTGAWNDTGVTVDNRSNTHSDVLWDGAHLYVASHLFVADGKPALAGYQSRLYRFSYSPVTRRYLLDLGFPATINNHRTETLVIDRDSTGVLWATWQQDNRIHVSHTTGDDRTWVTPFPLPAAGTSVALDDTSALLAFDGDKVGVMWSNQNSTQAAMYFAVHRDGRPDSEWEVSRTAVQGPGSADDHINLKSLGNDGTGRVFAAIKTSFTSAAAPLTMLLVRDPVTGDWTSHRISRVSDCPNRPIVVIDEENRVLHAYETAPTGPTFSCNSVGGAIYEKTSPLDDVAFADGPGTPVLRNVTSEQLSNVASSKQNARSGTGIPLLATDEATNNYWARLLPITPAVPESAPPPDFTVTATPPTRFIKPSQTTSFAVTASPTDGFSGSVGLAASGLPPGATASFSVNPVSVPSNATTKLTVRTLSSTPTGRYEIGITGTSGQLTRAAVVELRMVTK